MNSADLTKIAFSKVCTIQTIQISLLCRHVYFTLIKSSYLTQTDQFILITNKFFAHSEVFSVDEIRYFFYAYLSFFVKNTSEVLLHLFFRIRISLERYILCVLDKLIDMGV